MKRFSTKGMSVATRPLKSSSQLEQLKKHIQSRTYEGTQSWLKSRDMLIVVLMTNSMLRVSDCVNLRIQDMISTKVGESFPVTEIKTGKRRNVYMNQLVKQAFDAYYTQVKNYLDKRAYLIVNKQTIKDGGLRAMSKQAISNHLKNLSEEAGLPRVSSHSLRKTGATIRVLEKGVDIEIVSRLLNHSSVAISRKYIGMDREDIAKAAMIEI